MSRTPLSGSVLALLCASAACAHQKAPTFVALASGGRFTCARTADGRLFCWGWNGDGELGNGSTDPSTLPRAVRTDVRFRFHTLGNRHVCALDSVGSAYCWGSNPAGQLGIRSADVKPHAVPTRVETALHFRSLAAGANHTCGLADDGVLYCWGDNDEGQLGTGDTISRDIPTPVVGGLTFASVNINEGDDATCGLTADGDTYCWGDGVRGAGADPSAWTTDYGRCKNYCIAKPVRLPARTRITFTTLAAPYCGLHEGIAYCWNTKPDGFQVPEPISSSLHFSSLAAGGAHYCGLTADSVAYCWSTDEYREFGVAPTTPGWQVEPSRVPGIGRVALVAPGGSHICALTVSGEAYCWGRNRDGQLGTGTADSASTPVRVAGRS